jgi:hypothetical protein
MAAPIVITLTIRLAIIIPTTITLAAMPAAITATPAGSTAVTVGASTGVAATWAAVTDRDSALTARGGAAILPVARFQGASDPRQGKNSHLIDSTERALHLLSA